MKKWLFVLPLWAVLVLCCYWQPVVRDTWGHYHWHRNYPTDLHTLWWFAHDNYFHGNPRLGQVLTWLVTVHPWHMIVTPLVELAMFYAMTALALGRWPGKGDALSFATVSALALACMPATASMLFYEPFTGNYLYGFAMCMWLLVPYRFAIDRDLGGIPLAIGVFVLGFAGGSCNEHTGPAFGALMLAATYVCRKRLRPWMFAGIAGLAFGWLALMLAPGQDVRYNGLAQEAGTLQRILDRGVVKDLWWFVHPFIYVGWAVPWIALAAWKRGKPTRVVIASWIGAALVAGTILGSPKTGERLDFAATMLAVIGIAAWLQSEVPRVQAVLAAIAIAIVCGFCVATYAIVGPEGQARVDALEAAKPGEIVKVPKFSRGISRWFLGEDFNEVEHRKTVAHDFGAADIELQ